MLDEEFYIGQIIEITRWHRCAIDKPIVNGREMESPVQGRLVESVVVDRLQSVFAGEQKLKRILCMHEKVDGSSDETVRPIKADNIADFRTRFPAAFEEFKRRRGKDVDIKPNIASLAPELPPEMLKEVTREAQIVALRKKLAELEAEGGEAQDVSKEVSVEAPAISQHEETPLTNIKGLPANIRKALEHAGIVSCELLADISDTDIGFMGANGLKYRDAAKQAVTAAREARIAAAVSAAA